MVMHNSRWLAVWAAEPPGTPETATVRFLASPDDPARRAAPERITAGYPPGCPQKRGITRNGDRAGKSFAWLGGVGQRAARGDSANANTSDQGEMTLPRSFAHVVRS